MLKPANIRQDDKGIPHSDDYQDCYYSHNDGLAESRYVFLQGNAIQQRWQHQATFVIAETGFGTGLNFLATWQAWRETPVSERPKHLHFISFEKHPIPKPTLQLIHQQWQQQGWNELLPLAKQLQAHYPETIAGFHRAFFEHHQVSLTLCFMPAMEALKQLSITVNAWYLDGFSPSKNPDLWSLELLESIANLSDDNTSFATFTAASEVRKNLQKVGFDVQKRKGFGKKREMLHGTLNNSDKQQTALPPWFRYPPQKTESKTAIVIGGGIAGCQIAWHLAERDWQVTLLEQHSTLANEASGNKAGVIIPKMTAQPSQGETFYSQAFLYIIQQLRHLTLKGANIEWSECGALQLNHNERELQRWKALQTRGLPERFLSCVSKAKANELAGIELEQSASHFPHAAWLNPASLCKVLVHHPNIQVMFDTHVASLDSHQKQWRLFDKQSKLIEQSPHVIIANGKQIPELLDDAYLPFVPIAGQSSEVNADHYSEHLKTVIGHEGYLTPAFKGEHIFGATFDRDIKDVTLTDHATQQNHQQLSRHLPSLSDRFKHARNSHAAVRMTTPDRFPYVGTLPNTDFFLRCYADLHQGKHWKHYPDAEYRTGLHIFAGFASRGLTTTALCAETLASLMNKEPSPIQTDLQQQMHPARFLVKRLKRNAITRS